MRNFARIFLVGLIGTVIAPTARATDYALLIGASDYTNGGKSGLRSLKYPKNDVQDFSALLVECGYRKRDIVLMYDGQANNSYVPEFSKVRDQFDLQLKDLEADDSIIVALAGHGVQFAGDQVNYFCPLDADPQNQKNLISLTDVYDRLRECRAKRKLLLVDACRNDAVSVASRSGFEKLNLESVSRPQVEGVPKQTIAIFSCQEGQQSWEDESVKHGIFFYHVLKGLRGGADAPVPNGRITVRELADYVRAETTSYAKNKLKKNQAPFVKDEGGGVEWDLRTLPAQFAATALPLAEAHRLRLSGDPGAARKAYDGAILAQPKEAKAYLGRGLACLALGDTAAALADFQRAVRLGPESAAAWTSLGGARGRMGQFTEAVTAYSEAVKRAPTCAAALAGRGAAQVRQGRIDAGLIDLNRALSIEPDHIDALYNRAIAHRERGEIAAAERDFKRAKALEASGR